MNPVEIHIDVVFDHVTACAKSGTAHGTLMCPHGVALDPLTNHIYVAEGDVLTNFARVSVFSESGEYLNSYTHEFLQSLWGIVLHEKDVYVTDWVVNTVFHFRIEPDFHLVASRGSRGSGVGQFNEPRQLSISTDGHLYIADRDNDRVQVLDRSLHPIREITHPSMHKPCDVKLTSEEMYILSSEDSTCVHVFALTGCKKRSLITCGDGMQVTRAYFFCLSAKKCLIISDRSAHQIKLFSEEGTLLHTLGAPGLEAGTFNYPYGLTLTSNLKLVVTSFNYNYQLQIFSYCV